MLQWSESYEVGFPEIDAQHRLLVERLAALLRAMKDDPAEVDHLLEFLGRYAVEHFATEERLMERHAYPTAAGDAHRAAHAEFVQAFGRIRYDHELEQVTQGMSERIGGFLVGWLVDHILRVDKALAGWLVEHGALGAPELPRGTWVVPRAGCLAVLDVRPTGRLARAGILPGDQILAVAGERVAALGVERAAALITGPLGADGLALAVHPGGDRGRTEHRRIVPRARA